LPFCWNCGNEVQEGAKFCPNCAAPQSGPHKSRSDKTAESQAAGKRGGVWTGLSLADLGAGALLVLLGTLSLTVSGLGILFLAVGLVSMATGYAFWKAKRWGSMTGLLSGIGYLVVGFLLVLTLSPAYSTVGVLGILLGLFTLVLPRRKESRTYLAR
jgi:zinc-ribbon domain